MVFSVYVRVVPWFANFKVEEEAGISGEGE
jgi:hypothetical protein